MSLHNYADLQKIGFRSILGLILECLVGMSPREVPSVSQFCSLLTSQGLLFLKETYKFQKNTLPTTAPTSNGRPWSGRASSTWASRPGRIRHRLGRDAGQSLLGNGAPVKGASKCDCFLPARCCGTRPCRLKAFFRGGRPSGGLEVWPQEHQRARPPTEKH